MTVAINVCVPLNKGSKGSQAIQQGFFQVKSTANNGLRIGLPFFPE